LGHGRGVVSPGNPRTVIDNDGCANLRAADIERENRSCWQRKTSSVWIWWGACQF
jgi:hypothetical protein